MMKIYDISKTDDVVEIKQYVENNVNLNKFIYKNNIQDPLLKHGLYFGYPSCCITDFIFNSQRFYRNKRTIYSKLAANKVGQFGFMPCKEHCILILENKINIDSLIKNRTCISKFPYHNKYENDDILEQLIPAPFIRKWESIYQSID